MALVNPLPHIPVAPPKEPVKVTPAPYQGVAVDTKYIPTSALMTHVEGSKWTVNYYSQVLNTDSALAGQNVTRNAIYQQYKLIEGFELKVTQPLTYSQDASSKSMIAMGSANIYPFLIPNEGDMFVADIGDGRAGIFRITLSDRKTIYKNTAHAIEYQLIDYVTEERLSDLNVKVVETLKFVSDFLQFGQNPLIHKTDWDVIDELQNIYISIANRYFKTFTSSEFRTLIVPGQDCPIYDSFLTNAVTSFFTTYDTPEIRYIRKLNCDGDDVMKVTTIWDMLKTKDKTLFKYCLRQAGLVSVRAFTLNPMLEGIYHSGVQYVVYPINPELFVDYQIKRNAPALAEKTLQDTLSPIRDLSDLISDNEFEGLTLPDSPPIHKVLIDDYYVFSQAFYDKDTENQSILELCVNDYIDGKAPRISALLALARTCHSWNGLERFYYIPVLLVLIKAAIKF